MALCSTCGEIFSNHLDDLWETNENGEQYVRKHLQHHLQQASQKDTEPACYICKRLYEGHRRSESCWTQATFELRAPSQERPWYSLLTYYDNTIDLKRPTNSKGAHFVVQQSAPAAEMYGAVASGMTFTGSDEHMRLAQYWLSSCLESHDDCAKNKSPSWYPTRLLRVSGEYIQLIESSAYELSEPYATLSHSWGKKHFNCLTTENLTSFEHGLPLDTLPPTFRDAMHIAKGLEIHLVWIDCYCIIQSSKSADVEFTKDKMAEIARMNHVYSNALINLGASHGSGPHSGCFVHRERLQRECREFKWQPRDDTGEGIFCIREYYALEQLNSLFNQGLFKRGWVMQERLLASKMLHFTDGQLYWECAGLGAANELYPEGMPEHGPISSDRSGLGPLFTIDQKAKDDFDLWHQIVKSYSQLSLTWPSQDRLVAVGAIAANVAKKTGDAYFAGMFRGSLLYWLCWHTIEVPQRLSTSPSWSWASVNNPVRVLGSVHRNTPEPMATLVDVSVQLKDPSNSFDAVDSGRVVLRGRLLRCEIFAPKKGDRWNLTLVIEGTVDHACRLEKLFTGFKGMAEAKRSLFILPMLWDHAWSIEKAVVERKAGRDRGRSIDKHICGMLVVRQPDHCFRRLDTLFLSSLLLDIWAAKSEELITVV